MAGNVLGILTTLEHEAEQQLVAARRLDVPGLDSATQRRQDLVFELQLALQESPEEARSDEVRASVRRLERIDDRLARIVRSVLALLAQGDTQAPPDTYGAHGRLNG